MKRILLIIFVFITIASCQSQTSNKTVWTKEYEQKTYNDIDATLKARMPDESKRRQIITYLIARLKSALPNGLNSISNDSLYRLSTKISAEYGYEQAMKGSHETGIKPAKTAWTPVLENTFRQAFFHDETKENHETNVKLCNCALKKLKIIYPDSVVLPFQHDVLLKIASECHQEIFDKKNK